MGSSTSIACSSAPWSSAEANPSSRAAPTSSSSWSRRGRSAPGSSTCATAGSSASRQLRGRAEVREHGEHPAVRRRIRVEPELEEDLLYVRLDGPFGDEEPRRDRDRKSVV